MKKSLAFLLAVGLFAALCAFPAAASQETLPASALSGLTNNCPQTGIMIPETFSPYVGSYLLTVAGWVSRVIFTPESVDPKAVILVNGIPVASGQASQIIAMTDLPQQVMISVTASNGENTVYSVFLQRRPNEQRNSVSAGYLIDMYEQDGRTYLSLDLGSLTFAEGNISGFVNENVGDLYKYPVSKNCIFYYGSVSDPKLSTSAKDFREHVKLDGNELFYVVYIEDEIRAVFPFDSNTLQIVRSTAAPNATPISSFVMVTPAPGGDPVTLHEGEMGPLVSALQHALRSKGYYMGEIDGLYGTGTMDAVLNFQTVNKLTQDGIAGADTQSLLYGTPQSTVLPEHTASGSFVIVTPAAGGEYVTLQAGDMGPLVTALQQALTQQGFFKSAIDSFYGPETKDAVIAFQTYRGLEQDGIASPATLLVLYGGDNPKGS